LVGIGQNLPIRRLDTGRLSRKGKWTALAFIACGLATFFLRLIEFSPPAQGRRYWSVFETALQLQKALHPATPVVLVFFLPFGLVYATLLVAMAEVLLFRSGKRSCGSAWLDFFFLGRFA
jgi:sulfite exporter TauE/SafE